MTGVITSPTATFADIAQRPTWAAPFVIFCLLSLVAGLLLGQKTDWRSFFERQNSKNSRFDQMPQEQKDRVLEGQVKYTPMVTPVIAVVATALTVLVMTLIYWGAFNLFNGAALNFKTAFGITSHAFVPSMIGGILAVIILIIKPKGDIDPEHFLASSLSAFLPDPSPKWLEALGQSIELFWIWSLALIALGFAAASPKKITPAGALLTVFGIWALWVLGRVGWALL